ncbi:MAG: hypothetical protein ACKV2V_20025 [Blastocatellia bacterium]
MAGLAEADRQALERRYKSASFLAYACGGAAVVFLLLGRLVTMAVSWQGEMVRGFYYVALGLGMLAVMTRRAMLSQMQMRLIHRRGVSATLGRLGTVSIACVLLGVITALLGMTASLLGDMQYSWRLGVIGLLLIVYGFPRRGEWERNAKMAAEMSADKRDTDAGGLFT